MDELQEEKHGNSASPAASHASAGVGMAEAGWTIYNVLLDLTGGSSSKSDDSLSFAVSGLLSVAQCCPHWWNLEMLGTFVCWT